ncbi:hypothetical protein MTO96_016673 [Rhipicephalus appendiculatus]
MAAEDVVAEVGGCEVDRPSDEYRVVVDAAGTRHRDRLSWWTPTQCRQSRKATGHSCPRDTPEVTLGKTTWHWSTSLMRPQKINRQSGSSDLVPRPSAVAPSRLSFEMSVQRDSWKLVQAGRPLT